MDHGLDLVLSKDIDAREFKENFFYHFDKKETAALAVALLIGGTVYYAGTRAGMKPETVSVFMAASCVLPLLIGFFYRQGFGFLDYVRKAILLRACRDLVWESTEDVEKIEKCRKKYEENRMMQKGGQNEI